MYGGNPPLALQSRAQWPDASREMLRFFQQHRVLEG